MKARVESTCLLLGEPIGQPARTHAMVAVANGHSTSAPATIRSWTPNTKVPRLAANEITPTSRIRLAHLATRGCSSPRAPSPVPSQGQIASSTNADTATAVCSREPLPRAGRGARATAAVATPPAARAMRPAWRMPVRHQAVMTCRIPVTTKAAVIAQRCGTPVAARAEIGSRIGLKSSGTSHWATVHPPISAIAAPSEDSSAARGRRPGRARDSDIGSHSKSQTLSSCPVRAEP